MQQFMLVYEEVRRQDAAGGQDWVVRRGAGRRHTRQLTAWRPAGGGGTSGYLPLQDTSRQRAPVGLPGLQLLRGSGQGQFPGPGRLEGASGYLPTLPCLILYTRVVEVGAEGSVRGMSCLLSRQAIATY